MHLITGGSGFLGVALAKRLRCSGIDVCVYDVVRSPHLPNDIRFVKGDIQDFSTLSRATEGAEVIYHLAALIPQRRRSETLMTSVNVGGCENTLRCAVENRVKRLVYTSSVQVYGKFEGKIKEDAEKNPIGCYAKNKLQSEKICLEYFKKYGLEVSILRPPTIIGPEIDDKYVISMLSAIKNNGILPVIGNGLQKYNAIHISDCVDALILAATSKDAVGEVFNIGCEDVLSQIELIEKFKEHFKSKVKVIKINKTFAINLLRALDFFGISPVERVYIELSPYSNVMDVSKIKEKIGFVPKIDYLSAWFDTYKWYIESEK